MWRAILASALALAAACGEDEEEVSLPTADLRAPVDLALARGPSGERIFVANAEGGDLKVLDLAADGSLSWVVAPNRSGPLSVVGPERPQAIAAARGTVGGAARDVVFVVGAGSRVWAVDASQPVPVSPAGSFDAGSAAVAVAALPEQAGQPPRALVALHGPGGGALLVVSSDGRAAPTPGARISLDASPTSLAVLVRDDGTTDVLVGDGSTDGVLAVPLGGGAARRVAVGGPVLALGLAPAFTDDQGHVRRLLFASLAGGGLRPVEVSGAGESVPPDPVNPGQPWPLIEVPGLVMGMAFAPGARVRAGSAATVDVPLALAAASSDGKIYWVDATRLRVVNADKGVAEASAPVLSGAETAAAPAPELSGVTVTFGVTRSERWQVVFEGPLPGLGGRPAQVDGTTDGRLELVDNALGPVGFGALPDPARLILAAPPCSAVTGVLEYAIASAAGNRLVAAPLGSGFAPAPGPGCRGLVPYEIRPEGQWVVVGSRTGLAGLVEAAGGPFEYIARPFYIPDGAAPPNKPALAFTLVPGGSNVRGATFTLDTRSGVAPAFVGVDRSPTDFFNPFSYVAAVLFHPAPTPRIFAAMAGSDALITFDPAEGDTNLRELR